MKFFSTHYEVVMTDWTGSIYSGIISNWDYVNRKVHLSMPGCVTNALFQFQHLLPDDFTMTSHPYTAPVYGQKVQIAQQESTEPLLNKQDNTKVRQVVGKFLFYARAIDNNLLMGLNTLASE